LYYSEEALGKEDSEGNYVDAPDVMKEEVDKVFRGMKNGKSPEEDRLIAEMFKWAGEKMKEELAKLFSTCLRKRNIPASWNNAVIILLYKGTKNASKTTNQLVYCQFYTKCSPKLF